MENNYGLLINKDIKLHRNYFQQMTKLIGINCIYRGLMPGKKWTRYAEIDANYYEPIVVGCIFDQHPDQKTMKKLGWVSELQENELLIHLPYDTPNLQVGCLVVIPSGIDNSEGRLFRISKMSNIMIYPASISCSIVPEYYDNFNKDLVQNEHKNMNTLQQEDYNL